MSLGISGLISLLAATFSGLLLAANPGEPGRLALRVTSDNPDCPSSLEVKSALRQVLGDSDPSGWALWYGRDPALPPAERDATVLMELLDPAGERVAVRRIPALPGECAAVGTAMAAVVERSLRGLGWTRGEPLPESAGQRTPAEVVAPEHARVVIPGPATPSANRPPRLVLGAGPSFATSSRLGMNLLLEARVRVVGPLCLRLGGEVLAGSASESLPSAGTARVTLSSRAFTVAPWLAFTLGAAELGGGAVLLIAVDQGTSSNLSPRGSGARAVVAVGAGVGVAVRLASRWRVGLGLDLVRVAFAPDYYVELNGQKTPVPVLAPSPWQGVASAKVEFVAWP